MLHVSRLALLAALATILTAAPAAAAGQWRPMQGRMTASVGIAADQRCGAGAVTLEFDAEAIATHLGRVTGGGTNCTEPTLATGAVAIWDGLATYVAADGSTIFVTYAGAQEAPVAGVATATTHHTVVGGTGRFADAAGSWTVSGPVDFTTFSFSASFAGSITY
ncbi:MAG TPA: hypothetical protein VF071_12145 [Candidatus Limnocylindria bacterium]